MHAALSLHDLSRGCPFVVRSHFRPHSLHGAPGAGPKMAAGGRAVAEGSSKLDFTYLSNLSVHYSVDRLNSMIHSVFVAVRVVVVGSMKG